MIDKTNKNRRGTRLLFKSLGRGGGVRVPPPRGSGVPRVREGVKLKYWTRPRQNTADWIRKWSMSYIFVGIEVWGIEWKRCQNVIPLYNLREVRNRCEVPTTLDWVWWLLRLGPAIIKSLYHWDKYRCLGVSRESLMLLTGRYLRTKQKILSEKRSL